MTSVNYMELCRLCLVKDNVSIPIFDGDEDSRQILLKIKSCLPIKVAKEDKLPKKICNDCMLKLDSTYEFRNTTANAEKQLLQWLSETPEVNNIAPSNTIETEQLVLKEEAIEVGDQGSDLTKGACRVETNLGDKIERTANKDEEGTESDEDHTNTDDSGDDGLGKEEADFEDEPYEPLEPTTFVNVSLACDEAGPSGVHPTVEAQGEQPSSEFQAPSTSSAPPEIGSGYASEEFIHGLENLEDNASEPNWCRARYPIPFSYKNENSLQSYVNSCISNPEFLIPQYQFMQVPGTMLGQIMTAPLSQEQAHNNSSENVVNVTEESTRGNSYSCHLCTKTFKRLKDLVVHICTDTALAQKRHVCKICGYTTTFKHSLELHYRKHAREFVCSVCGENCSSAENLEQHKSLHNGKKSYFCSSCGNQYTTRYGLVLHKRMNHPEGDDRKKVHFCDICNKPFPKKANLEMHKITHTGEKPFKCDQCEKAYPNRGNLNVHIKNAHCEKKPEKETYICETCGRIYAHKKSLLLHRNTHTREFSYICDVCGKSLSSKDHMKQHMRIHTGEKPSVCSVCDKGFRTSSDLKQHMRIHTGERPYKCEFCNKGFTQRSALTIHSRYHTGQRPYVCGICERDFVCKALLTVHMKTHNK